jgi:alpha-galactosidase
MKTRLETLLFGLVATVAGASTAPSRPAREVVRFPGGAVRLDFDDRLWTRVVATFDGTETLLGPFRASERIVVGGKELSDFAHVRHDEQAIEDALGRGRRLTIVGRAEAPAVEKAVTVDVRDDLPRLALVRVRYANGGSEELEVGGWTNDDHALAASPSAARPPFWSFQSGSYESRPDWVLPLKKGFAQENFLGMNASDYGGGTPVVDVWRRDVGIAVGHAELVPRLVSLPVAMPTSSQATLAVRERRERTLKPGESFETLRTFVAVHRGDHFQALTDYAALMARQGIVLPKAPASAYEPIWCAWGYGREFTPDQVVGTLPVAKRLGFRWATLDDGWQVAEGDWVPVAAKFPKGDADMKSLVDRIHAQGMKAQLWWAPLAVDPGTPLHREHADQLLLDAAGAPRKITWWDSLYLCPAYAPVRADAAAFARKAIGEWGFDGLKIDGQHLNGAPSCLNPAHHHASPEESVEGVPGFFKAIFDAAIAAKPEALVEICPCGTAYSFFTLPYMNMAVASDPGSSWQVRLKGKTLRALTGDRTAYFGDHVELSDGGEDYASTFGIGGVIGTQFAWPGAPGKKDPKLLLTPAREKAWAFWTGLYESKRLSEGEYLGGLYDIGFDRPEAHAIRKGDALYYAFYAPRFDGAVELRGLRSGRYRVRDYVNDKDLGPVSGPVARLAVTFRRNLLLEARPEPMP